MDPGDVPHSGDRNGRSLAVREMAWAALLGRWVEFAKSSVAFPEDGDGGRWKRSVVPFIELQATVWALRELDQIDAPDRPVARDRAETLVRRASAALREVWGRHPMPAAILELQDDVTVALRESLYAELVELVWEGSGAYEVPAVEAGELVGTLAIMPPGSLAMPGEPIAWFTEREPIALPGCAARRAKRATQVYRELDGTGRFVRDLVAPLEGDIPPGLPMLVALSIDGTPVRGFTHNAAEWLALQHGAMGGRATIPVERVERV